MDVSSYGIGKGDRKDVSGAHAHTHAHAHIDTHTLLSKNFQLYYEIRNIQSEWTP